MKDLLEAGAHFGHQTKRWNPKMKPFIFGERSGIYILDLGKTVKLYNEAEHYVRQLAAEGKTILFVGTKRQAQDVVAEEAARCGMFYVNERWLGGLLTNFATIQRSIARLRDLEAMATDGRYDFMPKKEIARAEKEKRKLSEEPRRHPQHGPPARRAVRRRHPQGTDRRRRGAQAQDSGHRRRRHQLRSRPGRLRRSPVTTTRCASIRLFASRVADAVLDGRGERESQMAEQAQADAEAAAADEASRTVRPANLRRPQRPAEPPVPQA